METRRLAWWKLFAVWGLFLALHFSFETFPNTLFRLIGEDGETTFFHMKMLFFAYVFVTLVELAVRWSRLESPSDFVYSRALIAVAYPWLAITMWFSRRGTRFRDAQHHGRDRLREHHDGAWHLPRPKDGGGARPGAHEGVAQGDGRARVLLRGAGLRIVLVQDADAVLRDAPGLLGPLDAVRACREAEARLRSFALLAFAAHEAHPLVCEEPAQLDPR